MHIFSLFTLQRTLLRMLLGIFIVAIAVGAFSGEALALTAIGNTRDTGPSTLFSIAPFYDINTHRTPRPYFTYKMSPAMQLQDSVQVKNVGKIRGTAKIYAVDATTDQMSGMSFFSDKDPRHDVGAWISLGSQRVTLDPGQHIDIPFHLHVPKHVRPGTHSGGIVAEQVDQQSMHSAGPHQTSIALHIHFQLTLAVIVNLPGKTSEHLDATAITYDQRSHYQRVLVGLKNTGTQFLHPDGDLQILDQNGHCLQKTPMKLQIFLPQTAIDYPVYIHKRALKPGTYQAKLTLKYEHNYILNYTTSFVIPLPKSPSISHAISDLVASNTDFFSTLTLWHYLVGIFIIFAVLSSLFFWTKKLYTSTVNLRWTFKDRNTPD